MGKWNIKKYRALIAGALISVSAPAIAGVTTIIAQGTINGSDQFISFRPLGSNSPKETTYTFTFDKSVEDFRGQLDYYQAHEGNYFDAKGNFLYRMSDNYDDYFQWFSVPSPINKYSTSALEFYQRGVYGGHTYDGGHVTYDIGLIPYESSFSASTIDGATNYVLTAYQPVPEPSTWALMILGLGMVGGSLRSSKRIPGASRLRRGAF